MGRLGASTRRGMLVKAHTLGAVHRPPMSAWQSWIVPGQHSSSQIHRKDNFPDKRMKPAGGEKVEPYATFLEAGVHAVDARESASRTPSCRTTLARSHVLS